ncbi:MAG: arginine decarboxylase, pyruvoyl-dependent [Candidatus Margulisiibacteriota bacterium]|jgi:arginine decarboxylase
MNFVPHACFLTKGVGSHKEKLVSFEMALRKAGIAGYNLVRVSSIFPPKCKIVSTKEGQALLKPGQIVFCVLSDNAVNEKNRLVAASVGLALPQDTGKHGYLSEHHAYGEKDEEAGDYAEDMAAEMLATTLGISFDTNLEWDERKKIWKMQDQIVKTTAITQSAVGKSNIWTTVVAGAIFVL